MPLPKPRQVAAPAVAGLAALLLAAGDARAPEAQAELAVALAACVPAAARVEDSAAGPADAAASDPAQRALVKYLSRRFTIAAEATRQMVEVAHRAAREVGLDPLLVLAVIAVESRFNPIAESAMGAKGLMQIIPRFHRDKLLAAGGEEAVLDPEHNIHIGARILQEYVYRTGTLEAGLQFYNGAMSDGSAQYAQKVMAERARLEQVLRATQGAHDA